MRQDLQLAEGLSERDMERWVPSASILHSNGDALDIAVHDGRIAGVRGRAADRVNHGRLDPKDLFGWQANNSPDRLTRPLVRRDGTFVEVDWDEAMGALVERSRSLLDEPGGWGRIGFYTTGQLFLEEYYTLAVIGRAGIGTPHMDGNTRLCTATAAAALKASFGTDGQPGSYTDVDHCDAIALWGHNVAETQVVLWMRMLDRRRGPDPPRMLAVDPRSTPVAEEADVHLRVKPGTNLALMNGLTRELIEHDWVDRRYVAEHTLGFEELQRTVDPYTPERVADICALDVGELREAARIIGTAERLMSTVLQGFYQANQATASACGVNNIHLLRGLLGRPGAGVMQMNGQPTAQNTRETGADGDLSGLRTWDNPEHVRELAELWNVDVARIPHWAPPTHAMQIWRYAEQGSIELLWISATNPAVSLPDLGRIRRILEREGLFVVVQDLFMTETAELADLVLPAATWGEKTGTFTNADRTVHLSEQAVEPPGEARADLSIFLDYARRMDFKDRDGDPLVKWSEPEGAFEAWKACSRGRPCDYSGLSYARLRAEGGIQWGGERLYEDGRFNTETSYAETYGDDLLTGAAKTEREHRALRPAGRAFLHALDYQAPPGAPSEEHPLELITGRTVYQFHTRSKTGRAPELDAAAPEAWVELNPRDAEGLGIGEGDFVRLENPRGEIVVPARLRPIRRGTAFVPFHYGSWRHDGRAPGAANELTVTVWDPVSKQPMFKLAAVRVQPAIALEDARRSTLGRRGAGVPPSRAGSTTSSRAARARPVCVSSSSGRAPTTGADRRPPGRR